jgi:pimeloyl-ACP methyl ester carboxylesterase
MAGTADTIDVNGVRLDYIEAGSGVPVIFSHGSGSDVRYWEPQRPAFAREYRFVAYSRRFYGAGAGKHRGENSQAAHAADLIAIIDRLRSDGAHVVGFSAPVAVRAAVERPELFRTLTIVEPNIPALLEGDDYGESVLAWWRRENDRVRANADDPRRRAELWFELVNNQGPGTFGAQLPAFREMWIENMTAERPPAPSTSGPVCADLARIPVRSLAIATEHGMPYSRLIVDRIAACIPDCRLVSIPGVTHFVSYQDPDRFNEIVLAFLAGFDGQSA